MPLAPASEFERGRGKLGRRSPSRRGPDAQEEVTARGRARVS